MSLKVSNPVGLPQPDKKSLNQSKLVSDFIRSKIKESHGMISFKEFMHYATYAQDIGYYSGDSLNFGKCGDFITAPEESVIFGHSIAKHCASIIESIANASIVEFGAGSGSLAISLLKKMQEMNIKPRNYFIIDISEDLINRQKQKISKDIPELSSLVHWVTKMPENFQGIVIANEVADALPFERFIRADDEVLQVCVTADENRFAYDVIPADKKLNNYVISLEQKNGNRLKNDYLSEVSFEAEQWVKNIARNIDRGMLMIFDYGVSRKEYYSPDKDRGWTQCHFKHYAHNEPLIYPGIQDITTWVDFSLLAEAANSQGMKINGFLNQSQFIINSGIINELENFDQMDTKQQLTLTRQIKLLTLPNQMGENFKCLSLTKDFSPRDNDFINGDRSYVL